MAKIDELLQNYGGTLSKATIEKFYAHDDTPTKKYSKYMVITWLYTRNTHDKPRTTLELIKYVKKFDSLLPYIENKDIYHSIYKSWNNLCNIVNRAEEVKEDKTFVREEHADILVENDEYILLSPKTHKGSLKYGANTRWCTASKTHSGHFTSYKNGGYLYYLVRKKTNNSKWDKVAFYISNSGRGPLINEVQCYCSEDRLSNTNDLLKSDWALSTITQITLLVRSSAVSDFEMQHNTKNLKREIDKIAKIDVDYILTLIDKVNRGYDKEMADIVSTFKENMLKLNNKIKDKIYDGQQVTD